jgi:hypothetical protein
MRSNIKQVGLVAALLSTPWMLASSAGDVILAPPSSYNAISDTQVYPKPPLPKLGPAGFAFQEPIFRCPLVRVSDERTLEGRAIVTPATAFSNPWNADSTLFCLLADGAFNVPFRFNPKTMVANRIEGLPFLPDIGNEITFSRHDPNLCFGKDRRRLGIATFDFALNKPTDFIDVGQLTGLDVGYLGTLSVSANDVLALIFGGPTQDASPYVLLYDLKTKQHRLWNTKAGTVDGKPVAGAPHFTQHSGLLDLSGRYFVTLGPGVQGPIVWDTATDQIYPVTAQNEGHYALGYGEMVNCSRTYAHRALAVQEVDCAQGLLAHPAGEPYFAYDSHVSWNNARPNQHLPVVLSSYHIFEREDPKCAWGDEVIAVATDGSGKVWRFAQPRTSVHLRGEIGACNQSYNFWDCPRGNVSQDGRFYMFTSNWEETLGKDAHGRVREDAFVVKLDRER